MAQDVNSPDFVIGVIGTGTMGRGIAQISVTGGFKVKMYDAQEGAADKAQEVADEVSFPVGMEVSREIADALGSWWEDRRSIIQPSEFILGPDNKVLASSYADGPLGRIQADDVVKLITFYESQ